MSYGIRALFEPQRSLAFGSIVAGYTVIGTPFIHPIRNLIVNNATEVLLQFSRDGVDPHFVLLPNTSITLDITALRSEDDGFFLGEGDSIWVKRIGTPTVNGVYVSAIYGKGD